ncbi:hypothetical protein PybrP1_004825 [[Pythium] brassicae (nom. inval.)]|nr:hypothetical protein PybrP1_004825 [[Pythium] brassicae (nom. inval.)]
MTLPRGGARETRTKCTLGIASAMCENAEENCLYTFVQMQELIVFDFEVKLPTLTLATSMIEAHLQLAADELAASPGLATLT